MVEVGELTFDVLHCPGHSPGSVVYFGRAERLAIVADVLFAGSVGRTDLPGGDQQLLLTSIRDKLLPLGERRHDHQRTRANDHDRPRANNQSVIACSHSFEFFRTTAHCRRPQKGSHPATDEHRLEPSRRFKEQRKMHPAILAGRFRARAYAKNTEF